MTAALVSPSATIPEPSNATVAAAYMAVKALCDPDKTYKIDWFDFPKDETCTCDTHIVSRFARRLHAEAWLCAREVDENGDPVRGVNYPIFALKVDGAHDVRGDVVAQLKAKLAAVKEADDAC